jgi:hypothetical protein
MMSFQRQKGLFDAPFPSDDLRRADGTINLDQYPNPDMIPLIEQGFALMKTQKGFATSAAIQLQLTGPLDPARLPDLAGSVADGAPLFVVNVDIGAPDFMKKNPLQVAFYDDGGPFGSPNMLSLLPLQGRPLRPSATYAAVVTRKVVDKKGQPLDAAPALAQLIAGTAPAGMGADAFATYRRALDALSKNGVKLADVAALTVFTTGDPSAEMGLVRADMLSRPLPSPSPFTLDPDQFADYCVFDSTVAMPDYQNGAAPYQTDGGQWMFDSAGKPILQRMSPSKLFVTIPKTPMPPGGYPVVVFVRIGGGGDRPLIDRGTSAGGDFTGPIVPGSGPALYFAKAGFAGVQIDGPVGGLRNPSGDSSTDSLLFFNIMNAAALRDNVRETAAELTLLAHMIPTFTMGPCGSTSTVKLDTSHLGIMGHSNGAWVTPLAAAYEPLYGAVILSGAGGSYINNVMDKQKPLKVRPLAEILLNYNAIQRDMTYNDPGLTLVQWAAESSDPQVYGALVLPRNVLMMQGIVDHYILPTIANTTSLSVGLDLAGEALDATNAEEQMLHMPSLKSMLTFSGRQQISLPVTGNMGATTSVVVQHNGDTVEDGHEVVFQTDAPKHQYRCFLESWLKGVPTVLTDGAADAPCN